MTYLTEPLAEATNVTKRFGHVTAVSSVSFAVRPGEVVGLLGANGAGKTTVIRILLGLLGPTTGDVHLMGGPPDREHRSRIGYVPQSLGLYRDLTVAENLQFVAQTYHAPAPALPPQLREQQRRLVGDLSLGLQRQVAFVCALLHSPALLVLDEPTSGVDPVARAELWNTITEQAERGVGALVTTHYMQEAQQCDRLLLMSAGRLVAEGSEADIIGDTTAVQIVTPVWAAAFAALNAASLPVTLAGRAVRVANTDPGLIQAVLDNANVPATVSFAPATIEERMTVLDRLGQSG
ncbi:MAG: ABC transporter ATP-binding protein [Actinomycetes bacterium]